MGQQVNSVSYTGAGYGFNGKKRSESVASDSKDCVQPDLLTMKDGPTYALTGLDDATWKAMVRAAAYLCLASANLSAVREPSITMFVFDIVC